MLRYILFIFYFIHVVSVQTVEKLQFRDFLIVVYNRHIIISDTGPKEKSKYSFWKKTCTRECVCRSAPVFSTRAAGSSWRVILRLQYLLCEMMRVQLFVLGVSVLRARPNVVNVRVRVYILFRYRPAMDLVFYESTQNSFSWSSLSYRLLVIPVVLHSVTWFLTAFFCPVSPGCFMFRP